MFSQRKSFFKGKLFYIILLALFGFGIWLNQAPMEKNAPDEVNTYEKGLAATDDAVDAGKSGGYNDILDNIIWKSPTTVSPGGAGTTAGAVVPEEPAVNQEGYYLVKEVNGIIKIFYYDKEGKESLVRNTDIAFSLLSIADQKLFQKGVIKHTQD
ncbi:MAG TPA: hypothetical protein PKA19_07885, partial [Bacillota bacterium]|nr:hypothetical protein [Bacillota bacterium]